MMFATISTWAILITLAVVVAHWVAFPVKGRHEWSLCGLVRFKVHVLTMFFLPQELGVVGRLKKLVYLVGLLSFLILFLTGFVPRLLLGHVIHGYTLMVHATFAPVFAVCAAVAVVGYAQQCRLTRAEWDWVLRLVRGPWNGLLCDSALGYKLSFWAAAVLILPVALSMIASMFPIFGTHGQEVLMGIHRYAALALVVVVIVHVYAVMRLKFKAD